MITLNINDFVTVRLNEKGRQILSDIQKDLNNHIINAGGKGLPEIKFEVDVYGYSEQRFQLYDFMNLFGPYMIFAEELPFHPNIRIY